MRKKKNPSNKMQSYLVWTGALLAGNAAQGQIIYTDINPDITVNTNGGIYSLDLNNDGTMDYTIKQKTSNSSGTVNKSVFANVFNGAAIGANIVAGYSAIVGKPFAFNLNMPINNAVTWNGANVNRHVLAYTAVGSSSNITFGDWPGKVDKYLPLRIQVAGHALYGWARLDVSADGGSFTIKDYAYNATPDSSLLAGEVSHVGIIENNENTGISIYPNPASGYVIIGNDNNTSIKIKVYDMAGKELQSVSGNEKKIQMDISELSKGIYLVEIETGEYMLRKKLVKD